jgi:hypothetical protein
LELWLFGQWDQGWQAVYVDDVDVLPLNFQLETIDPAELSNPISFEHTIFSTGGKDIYAFYRHPVTRQPYTRRLFYVQPPESDSQSDQIIAIIQNLWDGADPDVIIDEMLGLTAVPTFTPNAQYYYYLGLAYELSGDEENAVAAYLTAWQDYCCDNWEDWPIEDLSTTANPYAIMAQAKLIPE